MGHSDKGHSDPGQGAGLTGSSSSPLSAETRLLGSCLDRISANGRSSWAGGDNGAASPPPRAVKWEKKCLFCFACSNLVSRLEGEHVPSHAGVQGRENQGPLGLRTKPDGQKDRRTEGDGAQPGSPWPGSGLARQGAAQLSLPGCKRPPCSAPHVVRTLSSGFPSPRLVLGF